MARVDAWDSRGIGRLGEVMAGHVGAGGVPGLAWLVARHGEVHAGAAGSFDLDGSRTVGRDAILRLSSMTKPATAVAALILLEECRLRLDDPVDRWLPELADRRVLRDPHGDIDDTVPAHRPITVRDVLTFRLGHGYDFAADGPQPVVAAMGDLDLSFGPPQPAKAPALDEWLRRLGTLPLSHQPGERWLYDTGADVLGALVARAADQPLDVFLRDRVFEPLGMTSTGFSVPAQRADRFGACFAPTPDGERQVLDPADGQWSTPPAFPAGSAGLVSTVDDWAAFSSMLLGGGTHAGVRILSRPSVEAMTTNHLTPEQLATSSPDPSGAMGWGFGTGVVVRRTGPTDPVGTFGWAGGLGSSWNVDPSNGLFGVLLTNQAWPAPSSPPAMLDFWAATYAAVA